MSLLNKAQPCNAAAGSVVNPISQLTNRGAPTPAAATPDTEAPSNNELATICPFNLSVHLSPWNIYPV